MILRCLLLLAAPALALAVLAQVPVLRRSRFVSRPRTLRRAEVSGQLRALPLRQPNAPKGGVVRLGFEGTLEILRLAVAGVKGEVEDRIGLIYDTLMTNSPMKSEPNTASWRKPCTTLRSPPSPMAAPGGALHDGSGDAVDVNFSFQALKANHLQYALYYKNP